MCFCCSKQSIITHDYVKRYSFQKVNNMKIEEFYNEAYSRMISDGLRFIIGMMTFFIGIWLTRLVLNWSYQGINGSNCQS